MVTHTGIEKPAPRVSVPRGKNSPADCGVGAGDGRTGHQKAPEFSVLLDFGAFYFCSAKNMMLYSEFLKLLVV